MDVTPEEYERVTQVTYLGQVNGTRAALKRMLPRDKGAIVLVGSALAYRGIPLQSAYCGSKHAIQGFIDSVRCELLHDKTKVTITMVQMPGVNTPQFDWIRAKLPGQPRPVGKVYQPEVAGRAIYFAAHDGRKEMLVGLPTVEAVWGNKVASSMMDDYLAATGFASQQRPERVSPDRKDNLFEPVAGDHGAHGSFDDEAVDSSAELWISEHKTQLGLAALGAAAIAGAGFMLAGRAARSDAAAPLQSQSAELSLACTHASPSLRTVRCSRSASPALPPRPALGWLLQRAWRPSADRNHRAAEALGAGAAILCLSVALDSGIEHYRGQFKDRAMFVGPTMALLGLGAATYIAFRPEGARRRLPKIALVTVGATGLIGLGFHTYNILKRPGELDALNLFYGAPMGAPAALTLAGLYGVIAGEMLSGRDYVRTRLPRHHRRADRLLADGHRSPKRGCFTSAATFQNPVDVRAGDHPAARGDQHRRGGALAARDRRCRAAAQGDRGARHRRADVPRLRDPPQHGRLAQLEPDDPAGAAPARAARVPRHCRRRSRHPARLSRRAVAVSDFRTPYLTYDVLDKWDSPSWNDQTREAIRAAARGGAAAAVPQRGAMVAARSDRRSAGAAAGPRGAGADRSVDRRHAPPQPRARATATPTCRRCATPGSRGSTRSLPKRAIATASASKSSSPDDQDELLRDVEHNRVESRYWGDLPAGGFFMHHLLKEVVGIYYSHPAAWSEIGFGGPASPARLCAARLRRARSVGSRRARRRGEADA